MVLVVDNYDSFTYNLVQYLGELGADIQVLRNDRVDENRMMRIRPDHIVISPGPGNPDEAGCSLDVINRYSRTIPTFGVCLGHQCIGQIFGAKIIHAPRLMHGKTSEITHDNKGIFEDIPDPFTATRYHSLVVDESTLGDDVVIQARSTDDNLIMGLSHKELPIHGVQFHPESILTSEGKNILKNFLRMYTPATS